MRVPSTVRAAGKEAVWRSAFLRWPRIEAPQAGYTAILPVPGDLPVFLRLAAAVIESQDPAHCVETIVVPDTETQAFHATYQQLSRTFEWSPLRLETLDRRSRAGHRAAGAAPGTNYFLQVYHGAARARGRHVLFHDADLFIDDRGFLARHYEQARDGAFGCFGVSPAWDTWLLEHGGSHVMATWELMLDTKWLRSYPPWQHRPHVSKWAGEDHSFDVTLLTQALSPAHACGRNPSTEALLHFNYVFSTYRQFERRLASGTPHGFEDRRFLLLLLRLIIDAFADVDDVASNLALPSMSELVRGIDAADGRIHYGPAAAANYGEFRGKLERLLNAPFIGDGRAEVIEGTLKPFDAAYG